MSTLITKEAGAETVIGPQAVKTADAKDRPVTSGTHPFAHLAASYEGEWWDDLLDEIKNNREQEAAGNEAG